MDICLIVSFFATPWGMLEVRHDEHSIYRALFTNHQGAQADHPLSCRVYDELQAYYLNPQHHFNLPLISQGSLHQQKIARALLAIPPGQTLTYGQIARQIDSSPRAVGQACKRNPLALFIPCHRVVGASGLGGYMGITDAVSYKIALLKHEHALMH